MTKNKCYKSSFKRETSIELSVNHAGKKKSPNTDTRYIGQPIYQSITNYNNF